MNSKKSAERPDPRMRQLATWHTSAGVHENLNLAHGQRLKLDNSAAGPTSSARPRKRVPDFAVNFSQLHGSELPPVPSVDVQSDDELPDTSALIDSVIRRSPRDRASSSSSYDIDDLIRAIPQEELDLLQSAHMPPAAAPAPLKRAREEHTAHSDDHTSRVRTKKFKSSLAEVVVQYAHNCFAKRIYLGGQSG
jgi:hypothetical protein